jgi:DNA-binding NtrC family response regulator
MLVSLDGIQMMERIKQKYTNVPAVFVSPVHDSSVALAAIRRGAYDYLRKPFDRDQLIDTVCRALGQNRPKRSQP